MFHRRIVVTSLSLIGFLCVPSLHAFKKEVSIGPGYLIPIGSTADQFKAAPTLDASVMVDLNPYFSVGAEFGFVFGQKYKTQTTRQDADSDNILEAITTASDLKRTAFRITPVVRYNIGADNSQMIKPYLIFGAGMYQSNKTNGSTRVTGTLSSLGPIDVTSSTTQDSEQNALVCLGVGAQTHLSETLILTADVRYQKIIFKSIRDNQYIQPTLKLGWVF